MVKDKRYIAVILILIVLAGLAIYTKRTVNKTKYPNLKILKDVIVFKEPKSLIEIEIDTLGEKLPQTKDEDELPVVIKISEGKKNVQAYGTIKVQGSSTARLPKKNWTLKLFKNKERTETLKIKIGDSIESDKWIAKAEWIDPPMLRNSISYGLWGDIVNNRKDEVKYEVDNGLKKAKTKKDFAKGYPSTYISKITMNDEYYGLSTLTLGHDPANFNIDKDNPKHVYMEFDARMGYTKVKTWEKFKSSGIGEWISGYSPKEDEDFTDEQKASIDNLGKLINGNQENFKKNFDKYLDKTNMIDMLIYMEAINDWDAVAQDIEMVTYDLEKWYMLPWDKDTTFRMNYDGSGLKENSANTLLIDYKKENPEQKPWYKTYHAFKNDVETRYAELRDEDVLTVTNINKLANKVNEKVSEEVWEEELERWKKDKRPSVGETDTNQILSWFEERLKVLDKQFNYNR